MSLSPVSFSILRCWDAPSPFGSAAASVSSSRKQKQNSVRLEGAVAELSAGIPLSRGLGAHRAYGFVSEMVGCNCVSLFAVTRRSSSAGLESMEEDDADDDDDPFDWESEIFENFDRRSGPNEEDEEKLKSAREEAALVDWATKARERAIRAIQERELPVAALLEDGTKRKKQKKKKKKVAAPDVRITKGKLEKLEKMARVLDENVQTHVDRPWMAGVGSKEGFQGLAALGNYWKNLGNDKEHGPPVLQEFSHKMFNPPSKTASSSANGAHGYSPSKVKRQEDFDLNRKLVEAADTTEVLSLVGTVIGDSVWGENECPLSPFNVSTALHRIAKHMETVSMHNSARLSFARNRVMAQLVSAATEYLPQCSAQSISNIAWALSKVGGHALYGAEMDLLSQVVMTKIPDLKPQHIANIAGALASMQHSVPHLFEALDLRASFYYYNFQPQELAQLLWAFATLNQPAKLLLDSLDSGCESTLQRMEENRGIESIIEDGDDMLPLYLSDSFLNGEELQIEIDVGKTLQVKSTPGLDAEFEFVSEISEQASGLISAKEYFKKCSLSQLASLSWSYTVLGQLGRPSFHLIWHSILNKGLGISSQGKDLPCPSLQLSQLYQTKLSLQMEYPHLGLSLGDPLEGLACTVWESQKSGRKSTSVVQLDVERLLVGTGRNWVAEYTATDYSLDAALVEEKIALEIDGPSHFTRNTGTPLGHTLLKRRQLSAAGWTVLSITHEEWDDQLGEAEQMCYLSNLLKGHL